jgi:DtxR family transcriptional regulator, Mn-dependent transcriptional regulator
MGHNVAVTTELVDTTEMYLRTLFELEEEGIVPLRARIAERLHQSGPTVSETVARMERDGLLTVEGDRHLELTDAGRQAATRVMRKHRLVERLLTDVIGLDLELVHDEACRWEHVVSEQVERRLVELLDHPTESPYGNPIPGLDELGEPRGAAEGFLVGVHTLSEAVATDGAAGGEVEVDVRRISEPLQAEVAVLADLRRVGALPGRTVRVRARPDGVELLGDGGDTALLSAQAAEHVLVRRG